MAGCINGLSNIEIKAPNGEPSSLFRKLSRRLDVNDAYRAYLLSEVEAVRQAHGLTLDENGEVRFEDLMSVLGNIRTTYNFKSDADPAEEPEAKVKDSVADKIVEEAKLIGDPEEDADGNQGDFYTLLDENGNVLKQVSRVSSFISRFIYSRDGKGKPEGKPLVDHLVENKVEREFRNVTVGDTINYRGKEYTKEQYAEALKNSYQQGIIKGNIIHAMLELKMTSHAPGSPEYISIQERIGKYKAMSLMPDTEYDWVLKKDVFESIMENLGIKRATAYNKMDISLQDKLHTEVSLANDILGIGGKIDTLRETARGELQVIDTKTGNNFDRNSIGNRIMRYGNQTGEILDNSLGRAKLQTVVYSMMIKLNHPEAKLLPPKILHIPGENRAKSPESVHEVEMADYLGMAEQFFKAEEPEMYKQLLAKSPALFNPNSYGAATSEQVVDEFLTSKDPSKLLYNKQLELQRLQQQVRLRMQELNATKGGWTVEEQLKRDKLTREILQGKALGIQIPLSLRADHEVKRLSQLLGTINDTHNPYIQGYSQLVEQARFKIRDEYQDVMDTYEGHVRKVLIERGEGDPNSNWSHNFRVKHSAAFFEKYIISRSAINDEGELIVDRGMVIPADAEWKSLSTAEQDMLSFIQKSMKDIFTEVMVTGEEAKVSFVNGKAVTKLDVYNAEDRNFQWEDDFIPKVSVTRDEVKFRALKNFSAATVKEFFVDWYKRSLSMYYEEHVDRDFDKGQYGIPARFLGSGKFAHNPEVHSADLDHIFKTFMQQYINKKHYDSPYALGDSIKQYMRVQQDSSGSPILENAADFLEKHITRQLQGRIRENDKTYTRKQFNLGNNEEGSLAFSPLKFGRTVATAMSAAGIWIKPISAFKNLVQAWWAVNKQGWAAEMAHANWAGLKTETKDTGANSYQIHKEWGKLQADLIQGKGRAHPIRVFMDTFQLNPDVSELGGTFSESMTGMGKLLSKKTLTALHSYPEEWSTAMLAVNIMMSMKITEGKYSGQSMWDVYSSNVTVDPATGKGKFTLPEDFTRGKIKDGTGEIRDWKGLEPIEVQKIKRIIQTVKGGYRLEERTMLEGTVVGEMAMIFKRWLPSAIVQGLHGKRSDPSMGFFEKKEGEDHFEWRARIAEGRWRTVAGVLLNKFHLSRGRGYNIDQLSDLQKQSLADAAITLVALGAMGLVMAAAFHDHEEKDSWKALGWDTTLRVAEQWNFLDWINSAASTPMVVKAALELTSGAVATSKAVANLAIGGDTEDSYTRRGDLKGANQVLKNLPLSSWYYSGEKFIDNIQD